MTTQDHFNRQRTGAADATDRDERAQRAVRVFRSMQYGLTGFARAITGNRKITVEMSTGAPRTDGHKIYYQPPIALGDKTPHQRRLCEKRDSVTRIQRCPACAIREEVMTNIFHEMGHVLFQSFTQPKDWELAEVVEHSIQQNGSAFGDIVRRRLAGAPTHVKQSYLGLAGLVSPYLPYIVNCLEDARVDTSMFEARKGVRAMMTASMHQIFSEGIEQPDGSMKMWQDAPLHSQASIACYIVGANFEGWEQWLHPVVVKAFEDPTIQDLIEKVRKAENASDTYNLAFPVLTRLRELGFFKTEEERQEEPPPFDNNGQSGNDDADEEGNSEDADSGDSSQGESSSEDESTSGDSGSEGESSQGERGDDESDQGSGDGDSDESEGAEGDAGSDASDGESGMADSDSDDNSGDEEQAGSEGASSDDSDEPAEGDQDSAGSGGGSEDNQEDEVDGRGSDSTGDSEGDGDDNGADSDNEAGEGSGESRDDHGPAGPGADSENESGEEGTADESLGDSQGDGTSEEAGEEAGDAGQGSQRSGDGSVERKSEPSDEESASQQDRLDTGADEGEGGVETDQPIPEYGEPEDVAEAVETFHKEEVVHVGQQEEDGDDEKAVKIAVVQGLYFETPSQRVEGVRFHKFGNPILNDRGQRMDYAWKRGHNEGLYGLDPHILGIEVDLDVPESIMGPALLQTRRVFTDNARAQHQPNLKSGRINKRVLGRRAWHDDNRLFTKKRLPGKKSYAVLIGIDVSGSTVGENLALAKRAAWAQAELCHRAGIRFAVYAHSAKTRDGGYGRAKPLVVDLYEIKSFDEPWDNNRQERLSVLASDSENLDGHTMEQYRKILMNENVTDRILLYYTDGKMPAANAQEELQILQREIKYCKRDQVTLLGVGIRTDSPVRHGLDTVQVNDDTDLKRVVMHLEKQLLRKAV